MKSRAGSAGVLVLFGLLAGCVGLLGGGSTGEPEQSAGTLTPSPEPTHAQTAGPSPGVTDPKFDTRPLIEATERDRRHASYRIRRTLTVETPNGSLTYDWTLWRAPDGRRTGRLRARGDAPFDPVFERTSFWGNRSVLYARSESAGSKPVITKFRDTEPYPYRPGDGLLTQALSTAHVTPVSTDGPQTVVQSTGPFRLPATVLPIASEASDSVTVRATVSLYGSLRCQSVSATGQSTPGRQSR